MIRVLVTLALCLFALGCEASIPEGRFVCESDGDCPPGQLCLLTNERCYVPDGG